MTHRNIDTLPVHLFFGKHLKLKEYPDVRQVLEKEWTAAFHDDELQIRARENIAMIQQENKQAFDRNRQAGSVYCEGELVAIVTSADV
ncbi:hypothetical protein WN48_04492 [Eufriesea mexicana]|nr:hypothetical protein WN48_04492 [Eufriesea mexicana]